MDIRVRYPSFFYEMSMNFLGSLSCSVSSTDTWATLWVSFNFNSSWVGNMEIVSEKSTALTGIRFLDFWIGSQA